MSLNDLEVCDLQWRKAGRSANNGACVEVAPVSGQIVVRDSKNPGGSLLRYSQQSWQDFVRTLKIENIFE
jgi:Domain of unknown function (DUF397)